MRNPTNTRSIPRVARVRLATMTGVVALVTTLVAAVTAGSATAGSATAAALPAGLAKFANCPVNNPKVTLCLYSKTTSTTFEIGSTTVTTKSPTTVSFGVAFKKSGQATVFLPDNGSQALQSPATPIPGGLLGIPGLDGGVLQVTATPQLIGSPTFSLTDLLTRKGAGLTLPIDVLVTNTVIDVLGSDCTIGDASSPITLDLTTGTTSPPPPNTPISGNPGTLTGESQGRLEVKGMKLVDNSFAVPGADNCGLDGTLDEILDIDKGLPSPAGSNTAILSGSSYTAPASLIRKYLG
jgi:hypothetical protein